MTISKDEREAREWFAEYVNNGGWQYPTAYAINKLRTILALLDRPAMPAPDEVPDEVLNKMQGEWYRSDINGGVGFDMMRAAYRALYDHYNPPPAPAKVEAWAVVGVCGNRVMCPTEADAKAISPRHPGSRIVRLVEADSHDQ